ncbi:MAG: tetratricopeptide repeat protein [Planctomycetes bacterium]|nr:tetratricopeptide repeat protein [Planctomycetota bacterium]
MEKTAKLSVGNKIALGALIVAFIAGIIVPVVLHLFTKKSVFPDIILIAKKVANKKELEKVVEKRQYLEEQLKLLSREKEEAYNKLTEVTLQNATETAFEVTEEGVIGKVKEKIRKKKKEAALNKARKEVRKKEKEEETLKKKVVGLTERIEELEAEAKASKEAGKEVPKLDTSQLIAFGSLIVGVISAIGGIVVPIVLSKKKEATQVVEVEVKGDEISGDGNIIGDSNVVSKSDGDGNVVGDNVVVTVDKRSGISEEAALDKIVEQAAARGQLEVEIDNSKDELAKAVARIKELEAGGNRPDAEKALDELRKSNDMSMLQALLIKDRDEHRNQVIQRNREIAAVAYLRGDIDIAKEAVGEILRLEPNDIDAINRKGNIHLLQGELDKASGCYNKILELGEKEKNDLWRATALGNLGLIYKMKGNLEKAEEMHLKSLEIEKKLGWQKEMAATYGNLGLVYETRGELEKAEEMHLKSLEITEKMDDKAKIAATYGNLGLVYYARGELEKAEEKFYAGLKIDEKLGRLDGIASNYGNLGIIYGKRGDLDKAEDMYLKSLKIAEKLGRLEGMANQYANLGAVYEERGDKDTAREYREKALELYKRIGMPHMVKKVQGWIDGLGE